MENRMLGYIKDRKTFETKQLLDIISADLYLNTINNNNSIVTVVGELSNIEGSFIVLDEGIWLIKTVNPNEGITELICEDIRNLFNRDIPVVSGSPEAIIGTAIATYWKELSDTMFACPYIEVVSTTTSSSIALDVENEHFNLKSYIYKANRLGNIGLKFEISNLNTLKITIAKYTPSVWNIDFTDSHNQLITEAFSNTSISKVSYNDNDYYLFDDGTYSTNPSAGTRVEGQWSVLLGDSDKEADAVANEFAKNSKSHLIEFATDYPLKWYDKVNLKVDDRIVSSYVSVLRKSNGRLYVKTGELTNTLTATISQIKEEVEEIKRYFNLGGGASQGLTSEVVFSGSSTTADITITNGTQYQWFIVDCKVKATDTGHITGVVPTIVLGTGSTSWCLNLTDEANYDSRYWYRSGNDVKVHTRARSSTGTYYTIIGIK